jgi:hypothetical protein
MKDKITHQLITTWISEFKQFTLIPSVGYLAFGNEKMIFLNWLVWEYSISFLS